MIEVRAAELAEIEAGAVLRPVSSDFSPVTPAMRRLDRIAGPVVEEQCARLGELPTGSAVITAGGGLRAGFIVHVAVRSAEENATGRVVRRGLENGLRRLVEWEIESVAVAPLGTGAGNLDAEEAAAVMVPVLADHLRTAAYPSHVVLVVEDAYQRSVFEAAVERWAGEHAGSGP
jgi:O-acetyl-ADP-ribose deacetylase (regulator of RNase III)